MQLTETTFSDSIKVDRDAGIIRDVKVLGRTSKNGREYSDKALDDATRIYEGVKVRFDHPPRNDPHKERQFIDSFGRLERLRRTPDGVYADLPFKKAHPLADLVCESAERFSKDFGLSHNAEGTVVTRDGKTIVESITRARGVDVVDSPASTQGIFESEEPSITLQLNETEQVATRDDKVDSKLKGGLERLIVGIFRDDSIDTAETVRKISQALKSYDKLHDLGEPGSNKPSAPMPDAAPMKESIQAGVREMDAPTTETKPTPDPKAANDVKVTVSETVESGSEITETQFRQFMESVVAENNALKAENAKLLKEKVAMEREVKARRLLESKGREANPFTEDGRRNVETLLRVDSESIWPTLIDSWPAKQDRKRPARTGSVLESNAGRRYHSPLDVHDGKSLVAAIFE